MTLRGGGKMKALSQILKSLCFIQKHRVNVVIVIVRPTLEGLYRPLPHKVAMCYYKLKYINSSKI